MEIKKLKALTAYKYLKKELKLLGINFKYLVSKKEFKKRYKVVKKLNKGILNREYIPVISYKTTTKLKDYLLKIKEKDVKLLQKNLIKKTKTIGLDNRVANEIIEMVEKETPLKYIKDMYDKPKVGNNTKVELINVPVKELIPIQKELYIKKILSNIIKYGIPSKKNFIKNRTLIVTKNNRIIDGHHRWLSAMIFDQNLEIEVLRIGLTLEEIYPILIEYNKVKKIKRKG